MLMFFFNKNLKRHKVKRIQNKLQRIGTYDVSKFVLMIKVIFLMVVLIVSLIVIKM